jgi:predicted RNase H-like nuclease (RuvC/YqgF family)
MGSSKNSEKMTAGEAVLRGSNRLAKRVVALSAEREDLREELAAAKAEAEELGRQLDAVREDLAWVERVANRRGVERDSLRKQLASEKQRATDRLTRIGGSLPLR